MATDTTSAEMSSNSKENIDPKQELVTIRDDKDESNYVVEGTLKFSGGVSLAVDVAKRDLAEGAALSGAMAEFLMSYYIPMVMLPPESNINELYIAATSDFESMFKTYRKIAGEETDNERIPRQDKMYLNKRGCLPKHLSKILASKTTLLPIFWLNNWSLGVVQMSQPDKGVVNGRFITVGGLNESEWNSRATEANDLYAHAAVRCAVSAAVSLTNSDNHLGAFPLIRCQSLPSERDTVDCGWFMCLHAELFSRNTSWTKLTDDEIRLFKLGAEEEAAFRARIRGMRREVADFLEKHAGCPLRFEGGLAAPDAGSLEVRESKEVVVTSS